MVVGRYMRLITVSALTAAASFVLLSFGLLYELSFHLIHNKLTAK